MLRRTLAIWATLSTIALSSATSSALAQPQPKTLRVVARSDLKVLDPTFTTAYITRDFGYMVYDTLFALDSRGNPQPQMVEKFNNSSDSKVWTFTLRPGLKFSDGSPVTSADAIASLQRWAGRDNMGRAMVAGGAEWKAADARTFTLTLSEPFGMVITALAKPSSYPAFILPERLAKQPTTAPISEVLGSGPYVFKREDWVPGNKAVFVRNEQYAARSEPPNGLAGSKKSNFERVEWLYLPDANSAVAALQRGEVDLMGALPPDYIAPLRADSNVKVGGGGAGQALLVLNHVQPPFDNIKARQAFQLAVNQERIVAAMGYPADMRKAYCHTFFICGSANDTSAGSQPYTKPDPVKAKALLAESGYKGEKVVLMAATDNAALNGAAMIVAQTLRSIGVNVDVQAMDWATLVARRSKRDAPNAGGWNVFVTDGGEFDVNSPLTSVFLGAACGNSLPGWPCDKQLDELRSAWVKEVDPARRKERLDAFQGRAYEAVAYINGGQFSQAFAVRANIKGVDKLWSGLPTVWALDK